MTLGILVGYQTGCQRPLWKQEVKGFESYEKGQFWYKWFGANPNAPKPQIGEQVRINYAIYKGDSLLNTSFGSEKPIYVQIPVPEFDNFFTNALQLMGEGDSLQVKVKAVDIPELLGDYQALFKGEDDWVDFRFRLYTIKDKATLEAEQKAEAEQLLLVNQKMQENIKECQSEQLSLKNTPTGLEYLLYAEGESPKTKIGDEVTIHYLCYNQEGVKIDESFDDMIPLQFKVGSNAIIDGISEGTLLLGKGGAAFLRIPPSLAYGAIGSPPLIAPNSPLFFYIELISIN